jgi:hypothetical protein
VRLGWPEIWERFLILCRGFGRGGTSALLRLAEARVVGMGVLPSLRYAFLMSSTEASCSHRQLLSQRLMSCKQTHIGQFQVGIVVPFDIRLHHDPGETVASQQ